MYPHLGGTRCAAFIFGYMNEIPPHPFKAFPSHLLQTWCTWCVSPSPPLTHSALPTLYVSTPMSALRLSQPLLQQAPDWLLFLGIFWKEAGIRVPRSPSVYTHTGAGSNSVNEGEPGGAMECGCILASSSIPTAMLPLSGTAMDV